MSLAAKLDKVLARHHELRNTLAAATISDPKEFGRLSKEYSDMTPVVDAIEEARKTEREIQDLQALLADKNTDTEMRDLAKLELEELKEKLPQQEYQIKILLLPKDVDDERNAILEVRAGTGGEEAGLFASDLFRMYQRFAANLGWKFEVLSLNETGLGAIKEASASISGKGVFSRLKFESGVHRVQRVPETEASGRIHTSAATVAVLPEAEEVDIHIDEKDLQIDVYRASGAGGQHVNTTDSAVRITHIPTGIVVTQQDERSQHKNRAKAMKVLRSRIYEQERLRKELERSADRRSQIGSGDRSERIRTYNFPQGRVTDHRVNVTLYKIDLIMEGECLDEIIDVLSAEDQAVKLAAAAED
ncbi:peptide chain release factor 1 [Candidatus Odyssella acanthamoebae]|uniref:Peptide chain release factor 1 n=1 Tax=Candidatus Odyssella acanthamoebae TaxID=91604 RepID=A0A077AZZ3_9PROT|nr:peptide chain release factor 1 [Candidatus Paracaedibacter acanthamoebae]AIK97278.1 peptide chain release factor 1 [Candidatus Paracaedibacter acanthamoebae]